MNELLIIGLIFSLFLKEPNRVASFTFFAFNLMHNIFFSGNDAFIYCSSDAMLSFAVISLLALLNKTKIILNLMAISIAYIVLSWIGYLVWDEGLPIDFINYIAIILALYAVCLVTSNGIINRLLKRLNNLYMYFNQGSNYF